MLTADSLNDTAVVATIFAPDDEAFADFIQQNSDLYTSVADFLQSTYLAPILQYHIIPNVTITLAAIQNGQHLTTSFASEERVLNEPTGSFDDDLYEVNGAQTTVFIIKADHSAGKASSIPVSCDELDRIPVSYDDVDRHGWICSL